MEKKPTADVCDEFGTEARVADPVFGDYGGETMFCGRVETLRTFEDNTKLKKLVSQSGNGRVIVVDGGASRRCALLGGNVAEEARKNGWAGVVINGCVRDADELRDTAIGVKALATCPRRSAKEDRGEVSVEVEFAGVRFRPGDVLYADADGLVLTEKTGPNH